MEQLNMGCKKEWRVVNKEKCNGIEEEGKTIKSPNKRSRINTWRGKGEENNT